MRGNSGVSWCGLVVGLMAPLAIAQSASRVACCGTGELAKAAPLPTAIEAVAFLAGDWSAARPTPGGGMDFTQEVWSAPSGNNMMGMFRWVGSDGQSRVFEMLTITEEDDSLVLRLRHQDAQGNAWEEQDRPATLHSSGVLVGDGSDGTSREVRFEDTTESCDLASCAYEITEAGTLKITVAFDDPARAGLVFDLARDGGGAAGAWAGEGADVERAKAPGEASALTPEQSRAVFGRFASMDGEWIGRSTKGWEERTIYQTVAGGSVVVERSFDAHPGEQMYTMVHMDGDRLMLTHYCVARNQPRLVCTAWDEDTGTATFEFLDATNLKSRDVGHMDKVIVRFLDDSHVTSQWTWYQDGVESWMEEIVLERAGE